MEETEESWIDSSLLALLAVNAFALGVALYTHMSLRDLMMLYLIQGAIIGFTHTLRLVSLQTETLGQKIRVGGFFFVHYGVFHVVLFLFLAFIEHGGPLGSPGGYVLCALAFLGSHAYSLRRNLARDAAGQPDSRVLSLMPYARILPMYGIVFSGVYFSGGGTRSVAVFAILKTIADLVMHTAEHYLYADGGDATDP